MEEDWIMRQIKQAVNGVGYLLKKQVDTIELGEIELESGETISRYDLILEYVQKQQFQEAFLLVNSLKYRMSVYDFKTISKWFTDLLKSINKENSELISIEEIEKYKELLSELM